jgi:purine catabolism regulator
MITINALVDRGELGLTLLAGDAGGERIVTWAHAVDLPDPWNWIHRGDLVMTTGAGMPSAAPDQAAWIARVVESHASGLVLAARPDAPDLCPEALEVAEAGRFPLLTASFELEFSRLARVVIESALESQRHRLARSERLFAAYATSLRTGGSFSDRLSLLGSRFGWALEVRRGRSVPSDGAGSSSGAATPGSGELAMPIPGRMPATLVVRPLDVGNVDSVPDPILINYLGGLLGIELEREAIERDQLREAGAELLEGVLTGDIDYATGRAALDRRGLTGSAIAAAFLPAGAAAWSVEEVHHSPALADLRPPLLVVDDVLIALLPDSDDVVEDLRGLLGEDTHAGASSPLNATTGFLEGMRQARLSLARAVDADAPHVRYAADRAVSLLPDSVTEATALARRYLGPLIDHDRSHGTELVTTVSVFLAADRSWKQTSEELHIHRQTLVYRLKTVEQLTGLKPTSTIGTSALWLALQASRAAGVLP